MTLQLFGSISVITVVLLFLSFMFGLWDTPPNTAGPSQGAVCLMFVGLYIVITGCAYVTFAFWHKFLGPYFF
jgi:hypothetical protein